MKTEYNMGDRLQVQIKDNTDNNVYLYTHWGGSRVRKNLQKYLLRAKEAGRLYDSPYLARMVFCDMLDGDVDGSTGFGIMSYRQGDADLVVVDLDNGTVDGVSFEEYFPSEEGLRSHEHPEKI